MYIYNMSKLYHFAIPFNQITVGESVYQKFNPYVKYIYSESNLMRENL